MKIEEFFLHLNMKRVCPQNVRSNIVYRGKFYRKLQLACFGIVILWFEFSEQIMACIRIIGKIKPFLANFLRLVLNQLQVTIIGVESYALSMHLDVFVSTSSSGLP